MAKIEMLLSEFSISFYFWLLKYDSMCYTYYVLFSGIVEQSFANRHLIRKSICECHSQSTE